MKRRRGGTGGSERWCNLKEHVDAGSRRRSQASTRRRSGSGWGRREERQQEPAIVPEGDWPPARGGGKRVEPVPEASREGGYGA